MGMPDVHLRDTRNQLIQFFVESLVFKKETAESGIDEGP